jgi:gas vesicle protein
MKKNRQEHEHEYEYLTENTSSVKPILSGLLLGGLVGAGTALLFAPKSGEETRAAIQSKTMELRDRTTEGVKGAVSQVTSKTRQVASTVRGRSQELVHQGKEVLEHQLDAASKAINRKKAVQSYE